MQLDSEQRSLLNRAVAQARAFERERHAIELEHMRDELSALKSESVTKWGELLCELEAARDELDATKAELTKLRMLHAQAQQERESVWRDRMWADAMLAQREPGQLLN